MSHIVTLNLITKSEKGWDKAFGSLSTFALALGSCQDFSSITVSSVDMEDELELDEDLDEVSEFHGENTMTKVYDAILKGLHSGNISYTDEEVATSIVTALQNAGILFREIKK